MSSVFVNPNNGGKLPRFTSDDVGLESALNLLAQAIEKKQLPDIGFAGKDGHVNWQKNSVTLRPNIPRKQPDIAPPWQPLFFMSDQFTPNVSFNIGTVNGVVASNYAKKFSIADDQTYFVVLDVITATGKVTSVTLQLKSSPPPSDSVTENTPPSSFSIVLGAIIRMEPYMIVTRNIEAVATEIFRKTKTPSSDGAEPFTRYYRWAYSTN